MELVIRNIHMNRQKCRSSLQLTIDNDLNVPDVKPDIDKVIREQGEIRLQDVKTANGRVMVKGILVFRILYISAGGDYQVQHMDGQIPFDETINMNDSCTGDNIQVRWELEDLSADIINSRKISIKAIVKLIVSAEEIMDEQAAVGVDADETVEKLNCSRTITELALSKKDIFRIKDEVRIPLGRESIRELLYQDVIPEEIEMRLIQDQLSLRGELRVFVLYLGIEDERINAFETSIPFTGEVDCHGCDENMISQVHITTQDCDIQIKADEDGEDRVLDIETVLGLGIQVYKETELELLADMFSTVSELEPVLKNAMFDNLIMKNNSKVRINDRLSLEDGQPGILQICNASGSVSIDDERIVQGGIETEGVVEIHLLYFTDGEGSPIGSFVGAIPFTQLVEVKDINENCTYELSTTVEQINVMVNDEREMEIKSVIGIDVIVFEHFNQPIITEMSISERKTDELQNMPGLTGYIVQKGDNLWNIAKQFGMPINMIREMNELNDDELAPGSKILLVKQVNIGGI